VAVGFRHAKNAQSGLEFIERTHYAPYLEKRSQSLAGQLRRHGVDFRNPLNETPLMIAARLGRADLVEELLALGADPQLRDNAGRTALQIALKAWRDKRITKPAALADVYRRLARDPIRLKVGDRMVKLDPSSMEWFLLNYCLLEHRQQLATVGEHAIPAFTAPLLEQRLSAFPDSVLAPHRKKRPYLSAMLSKNELTGSNPYNRRLFLRIGHGIYLPNPTLELGERDAWVGVAELMALDHLFATQGAAGEHRARWLANLRKRVEEHPGQAAFPDTVSRAAE
jgi:hypothetical protein